MTVGDIVSEPLEVHGIGTRKSRRDSVRQLLDVVGFDPTFTNRYPHEFSGGQRQRIGIARALALNPKLIVCDEPVSALDVSIQAQILNLLSDLQGELELTYVFIAHDLSVVRHVSDRIAVMYLGKVVEVADTQELFARPRHPYTRALLSAMAEPDPDAADSRRRVLLTGDVPSPIDPPSGCSFHPRCPKAGPRCPADVPELVPQFEDSAAHRAACHYPLADGEVMG
jgi:oligopeptide/dipeptide ABC transporter ATP-binding protein